MTTDNLNRQIDWLVGGDVGASSKCIFGVMTGRDMGGSEPSDVHDFERCRRFFALFPEWLDRLEEVSAKYPHWGPMVAAWDELETMYAEHRQKPSLKLYERIRALGAEGWKLQRERSSPK